MMSMKKKMNESIPFNYAQAVISSASAFERW